MVFHVPPCLSTTGSTLIFCVYAMQIWVLFYEVLAIQNWHIKNSGIVFLFCFATLTWVSEAQVILISKSSMKIFYQCWLRLIWQGCCYFSWILSSQCSFMCSGQSELKILHYLGKITKYLITHVHTIPGYIIPPWEYWAFFFCNCGAIAMVILCLIHWYGQISASSSRMQR